MLSLSLSSSLPFQSFAFPILSLTHDLFLSLSHTHTRYISLSSSLPFQSFAFPILSLTHDLFLSLSHTRYIYISLSLVYSARSAFAVLLLPGIISTYNVNVVVDVVVVVILWKLPPSNRFCHLSSN